MKQMTVKQWFGVILKVLLAGVVIAFEVSQSIEFFSFVYPPDKWYEAYLGLGLTSGAMLIYMYLFAFDGKSSLQRTLSLMMMVISILASITVAGFGMQVEAWRKSGIIMSESDISFMILAVRILLFVHGGVLAMYFTGDKIVAALGDDDGDGVPNFADPDYREWKRQQKDARRQIQENQRSQQNQPRHPDRQFASNAEEIAALQKRLSELDPTNAGSQSDRTPRKDNSQNS